MLRRIAPFLFALLAAAASARAQEPLPLEAIVRQVAWDAAERGPLLVVYRKGSDPWSLAPAPEGAPPPTLPPADADGAWRLKDLAAVYRRTILRCGGVSVFAPERMAVLRDKNLPRLDLTSTLPLDLRLRALLASLSDSQWRKLASPEGIGTADLSREQAGHFLAVLPQPIRLLQDERETITLSEAQRAGVRLSFFRRLAWSFDEGKVETGRLDGPLELSGELRPSGLFVNDTDRILNTTLREWLPNRLKPGDLDFAAGGLNAPVPLEGISTVGDLVARAAEATRLELHADTRLRDLGVYLRGERARAGDLLEALCRGATAAFRRLGPAYVLTDDRVGFGVRRTRQNDWVASGVERLLERDAKTSAGLNARAESFLTYAPDDPYAPTPEIQKRIEAFQEEARRNPYVESVDSVGAQRVIRRSPRRLQLPVAELSAATQTEIARQVAWLSQLRRPVQVNRTDQIRFEDRRQFRLLLPDTRTVWLRLSVSLGLADPNLEPPRILFPPPPATVALPPLPLRLLAIAPTEEDSLKRIARLARERGMNALAVTTQLNEPETLERQVKLLRAAGLDAWAAIAPAIAPPDADWPRERNLLGEDGRGAAQNFWEFPSDAHQPLAPREIADWVRIDHPQTPELAAERIARLAATPGLAGLLLTGLDRQPAGYGLRIDWSISRSTDEMGFSEEQRLACLRLSGVDPIDLTPYSRGAEKLLPSYPFGSVLDLPNFLDLKDGFRRSAYGAFDASPVRKTWDSVRAEALVTFRQALLRRLRAATRLPLLCQTAAYPRVLGSWEKEPPPSARNDPFEDIASLRAASASLLYLSQVATLTPGEDPVEAYRRTAAFLADKLKTGWDGIVVDGRRVDTERLLKLLAAFPQPPSAAGAAAGVAPP